MRNPAVVQMDLVMRMAMRFALEDLKAEDLVIQRGTPLT